MKKRAPWFRAAVLLLPLLLCSCECLLDVLLDTEDDCERQNRQYGERRAMSAPYVSPCHR